MLQARHRVRGDIAHSDRVTSFNPATELAGKIELYGPAAQLAAHRETPLTTS